MTFKGKTVSPFLAVSRRVLQILKMNTFLAFLSRARANTNTGIEKFVVTSTRVDDDWTLKESSVYRRPIPGRVTRRIRSAYLRSSSLSATYDTFTEQKLRATINHVYKETLDPSFVRIFFDELSLGKNNRRSFKK